MSHSVKRSKSKNEQFRLTVPEDLRELVGKREWTQSLGTTDRLKADAERGRLIAHYKSEIERLRAQANRRLGERAAALVDRAFDRLSVVCGSMDAAIAQQLTLLGVQVCESWSPVDFDRRQQWNDIVVEEPKADLSPIPSIDDELDREIFRLRADLIEGRGIADGFVYRELAQLVLSRRAFQDIEFVVSYIRTFEGGLGALWVPAYEAIAERYLTRLTEHAFTSWPATIERAVGGARQAPAALAAPVQLPPAHPLPAPTGLWVKPLFEALAYWADQRRPGTSAITEARRAVARFSALFGDMPAGAITREQVIEFRNLVADLPPGTELARVQASGRTLKQVIEDARTARQSWEEGGRKGPEPERLAPASVKKDVGALSQILGAIRDDCGSGINVAERVPIAGYGKSRRDQKKPRLSLTPEMMQMVFDSPLFTGCAGKSDIQRTRPGDQLYQDELYWPFLFGVVGGPRLGEIGQIALSDVHRCDLRRTYGDEYNGECTFVHITGTGEGQRVKNDGSDRYVVLHQRLIELGFNDYVEQRRTAGKTTLFDLPSGGSGAPTKALSQRLNRYLDRVVIDDNRYVFHSFRHEFTDRAELSDIPARVANSIKGHAHAAVADKYGLVSILAQHLNLKKLNVGFIDWDRLMLARVNSAHRRG